MKSFLQKHKVLVGLTILLIAVGVAVWAIVQHNKPRTFTGTVTLIGLEGATVDGPVYYQVQVSPQKSEDVYFTSSPTPENPNGLPLPKVKVGDKVKVRGNKGAKGSYTVGMPGTYIKLVP